MVEQPTIEEQVDSVTRELTATLAPVADPEAVRRLTRQAFDAYAGARVTTFVPIFVRRHVVAQVRGQLSQFLDQQGMSKEGPVTKMISKPTPPPTRHMPM